MAWQTGKSAFVGAGGKGLPRQSPKSWGRQFRRRPGRRASLPVSLPRAPCPSRTGSKVSPAALRTCLLSCASGRPMDTRLSLDIGGAVGRAGLLLGAPSSAPLQAPSVPEACPRGLPVARMEKCPHCISRGRPAASRLCSLREDPLLPESRQARGLSHPPGRGAAAAFPAPSCGCFSLMRGWLEASGRGRVQTCPLPRLGAWFRGTASPRGKTHPLLFCHQFEVLEDLKRKSSLNTLSSLSLSPAQPCLSFLSPRQPTFLKKAAGHVVFIALHSLFSPRFYFLLLQSHWKVSLKKLLLSSWLHHPKFRSQNRALLGIFGSHWSTGNTPSFLKCNPHPQYSLSSSLLFSLAFSISFQRLLFLGPSLNVVHIFLPWQLFYLLLLAIQPKIKFSSLITCKSKGPD